MNHLTLSAWPISLEREFTRAYLRTVTRIDYLPSFGGRYLLVSPMGNEEIPYAWVSL